MGLVLYHNPRCSTSRQALSLLRDRGFEPVIVLYLETPPTLAELKAIVKKAKLTPRDLLRTKEPAYVELGLDDETVTDATLLKAMVENPVLIERPILVSGARAVVGRPPEKILDIL